MSQPSVLGLSWLLSSLQPEHSAVSLIQTCSSQSAFPGLCGGVFIHWACRLTAEGTFVLPTLLHLPISLCPQYQICAFSAFGLLPFWFKLIRSHLQDSAVMTPHITLLPGLPISSPTAPGTVVVIMLDTFSKCKWFYFDFGGEFRYTTMHLLWSGRPWLCSPTSCLHALSPFFTPSFPPTDPSCGLLRTSLCIFCTRSPLCMNCVLIFPLFSYFWLWNVLSFTYCLSSS